MVLGTIQLPVDLGDKQMRIVDRLQALSYKGE
jgi:hypothetical protein